MADAASYFGFARFWILLRSLRRGGATSHYLEHANLPMTMIRGRWQQQSTAQKYIDSAMAFILHQVTASEWQSITVAATQLPHLLRSA
eukprot:3188868-Amphidinium_carterae.2